MDYMRQFNAFGVKSAGILSSGAVNVYVRLFLLNNQHHWTEYFPASHSLLCAMSGIGSRNTINSLLDELKQQGFIEWKKGGGRKPNLYKLVNLYCSEIEQQNIKCSKIEQQTEQQTEHIKDYRHKTIDNKKKSASHSKKATSKTQYAEAVAMTNDEHTSLMDKLGSDEAVSWCIEKLNNYKLSSGKEYRSDYRAILSWVIGEYERSHGSGQNYIGAGGTAGKGQKPAVDPSIDDLPGWEGIE